MDLKEAEDKLREVEARVGPDTTPRVSDFVRAGEAHRGKLDAAAFLENGIVDEEAVANEIERVRLEHGPDISIYMMSYACTLQTWLKVKGARKYTSFGDVFEAVRREEREGRAKAQDLIAEYGATSPERIWAAYAKCQPVDAYTRSFRSALAERIKEPYDEQIVTYRGKRVRAMRAGIGPQRPMDTKPV